MTIYEQARECLSAKHKHMIYSSHEYRAIIAGLLEAIDAGKCKPAKVQPTGEGEK